MLRILSSSTNSSTQIHHIQQQQREQQEFDSRRNLVAADLWHAANDPDFHDVWLLGSDHYDNNHQEDTTTSDDHIVQQHNGGVPANRFVLAARSPVFRRMLYGNFCEASTRTIRLLAFDRLTLAAVVEFCSTHALQAFQQHLCSCDFFDNNHSLETTARCWVQVQLAADYLELPALQQIALAETRRLMTAHPALACAVWDDAVPDSELSQAAWQIIATRPYVALDTSFMMKVNDTTAAERVQQQPPMYSHFYSPASGGGSAAANAGAGTTATGGGVECLSRSDRLIQLAQNQTICCGELFLFRMITRWYQHRAKLLQQQQQHDKSQEEKLNTDNSHKNQAALATNANEEHQCDDNAALQHIRQAAQTASQYVRLEDIEPVQLLSRNGPIQDCPFAVPADRIFQAVAKQALLASQNRVWTMQCRGGGSSSSNEALSCSNTSTNIPTSVVMNHSTTTNNNLERQDRVLVENCGVPNANGLYCCIIPDRLYTKRCPAELACGESDAYTLSRSIVKKKKKNKLQQHLQTTNADNNNTEKEEEDVVECRIFKSPILTHRAVTRLRRHASAGPAAGAAALSSTMMDPTFQPVLQIVSLYHPEAAATTVATAWAGGCGTGNTALTNKTATPSGCWQITVSDGTCCMTGTLADSFVTDIQNGHIAELSVIHVLQFGLYRESDDNNRSNQRASPSNSSNHSSSIHITKLSVLATSPGHLFGRMVNEQQQQQRTNNAHRGSVANLFPNDMRAMSNRYPYHQQYGIAVAEEEDNDTFGGLCHHLYSCSYPVSRPAKDKIPRTGWKVDEQGCSPSPTCTWIPARYS